MINLKKKNIIAQRIIFWPGFGPIFEQWPAYSWPAIHSPACMIAWLGQNTVRKYVKLTTEHC
jgi:hypothetical protein